MSGLVWEQKGKSSTQLFIIFSLFLDIRSAYEEKGMWFLLLKKAEKAFTFL